jgi:molybdopterin adenylyltransferase
VKVAILTVSDRCSRGEAVDRSGPALAEAVRRAGGQVVQTALVPDEQSRIEVVLRRWADGGQADVVLTTGGTGVAPRDVTPEATLAVVERRVPGLAEAMRAASLAKAPNAMLSRAEAGIRGRCLILNLPGSPAGAVDCFAVAAPVLPHAVDLLHDRRPDP